MSYRLAGRVLNDLLPLGRTIRPTDLARQVAKVADRLDDELPPERFCYLDPQADPDLPRPELPLVVAIDGGFIHSSEQRSRRDGWFQAIVGSVTHADGSRRRFGFVPSIDHQPKASSTAVRHVHNVDVEPRAGSRLDRMSASRKVITAAEMDKMTPQERADAVDASIVHSWDEVDPKFRDRVVQRARELANTYGDDA